MKQKILFIILSYYLAINSIMGQTVGWAKSESRSTYVTFTNLVVHDNFGNTFIGGKMISSGGMYIIKYDSNSNKLWEKNYPGNSASLGSMSLDNSGNLYVYFFAPTVDGISYNSNNGGLFAKYDGLGNIIWIKQIKYWISLSKKTDQNDNLVITGQFQDTVHLDNNINLQGPHNIATFFLARFNTNGECVWAIQNEGGDHIYQNTNDDFFVTGTVYTPSITLGKDTNQVTFYPSNGYSYCGKYNSTGDLIWAKQLIPALIAPDEYGNAYILELDSNYPNTGFVTKYDTVGNLLWQRTSIYTNVSYKMQMQCGVNGDLYISGGFKNSMTIDSTVIAGGSDYKMFLAKLDSSGTLKWITTSSGSGGAGAKDIFVSGNEIFITGDMGGQNTFGSYSLNEPNGGVFTLKITDDEMLSTFVNEKTFATNGLTVYPNPSNQIITVLYSKPDTRQLQLSIKNQLGQVVYIFTTNDVQEKFIKDIDLGKQAKGVYFIEVVADEERLVKKIVLD